VRFWLKDSERRPDPAPLKTDDRKAFLAGSIAWVVALVLTLALKTEAWLVWACVAGLAIGLIGLGWSVWKRRAQ